MKIGSYNITTSIQTINIENAYRYVNDTGWTLCIYFPEGNWTNETDDDTIVDAILSEIKPHVDDFVKRECVLQKAWVNIHSDRDDRADPHDHEETDYTSIYYVHAPDNCGELFARIGNKVHDFMPKEGLLVVMDGDVVHWTDHNESGSPRVSIVCDWLIDFDK